MVKVAGSIYKTPAGNREGNLCEMDVEADRCVFREHRYAMKKHSATRLHYDLRLEWKGVLLSWALAPGPSTYAGVVRRAVEMPDHRVEYLPFEGLHRTGPIMLWDRGTWEPDLESDDIESGLQRGILRFTLRGEKLKGAWTLARLTAKETLKPVWTLCKGADRFAETRAGRCILKERPNSILTGKTMEEIVQSWTKPRNKHPGQSMLFDL